MYSTKKKMHFRLLFGHFIIFVRSYHTLSLARDSLRSIKAEYTNNKALTNTGVQCDAIRWEQFLMRCRLGQLKHGILGM